MRHAQKNFKVYIVLYFNEHTHPNVKFLIKIISNFKNNFTLNFTFYNKKKT